MKAKIRPLGNPALEKASLTGAAQVYVSRDALSLLTGGSMDNGRLCYIERIGSSAAAAAAPTETPTPLRREARLCTLVGKDVNPNVVQLSGAFQAASGFSTTDVVEITLGGTVPEASLVEVKEVQGEKCETEALEESHFPHWEYALAGYFDRAKDIFPGMRVEGATLGRQRRSFKVITVNGDADNLAAHSRANTQIRILPSGPSAPLAPSAPAHLLLQHVPGHARPVAALNDFFAGFARPFAFRNERTSAAAVLHGAHGTGKSFLLDRVAATGWGKVFRVRPGDKSSAIRDTFKTARALRPAIVLLDDLHRILRKDRAGYDAVLDVLEDELDALARDIEPSQALPQVVVLASCLDHMEDVPHELNKKGRFEENIMLAVPSADERLEILKAMEVPLPLHVRDQHLLEIAKRTHAYNPHDLEKLVTKSLRLAATRLHSSLSSLSPSSSQQPQAQDTPPALAPAPTPTISITDLEAALPTTRPSTMAGINLKPPVVRWDDIGGQDDVKRALKRMVHLTTTATSDPALRRLIVTIPKGMLLFGPPGCSKTLSAQAFATESGFNFFSVKGAELLNMYVGESERAMRNLFARASAASPSIIFFDEIDSIGGQRGGAGLSGAGGGDGGGGSSRSQSSVNLITTMLTEMDGFETLSGVLVIAATNRPDAIDAALLRPGRFDQVVYVGPPDRATREAIFRVHLRKAALADDVDFGELADSTEGHSGANIKHICAEAGLAVLNRIMEEGAGEPRIGMDDLREAVGHAPRLITQSMVEGYERWQRQFRPHK